MGAKGEIILFLSARKRVLETQKELPRICRAYFAVRSLRLVTIYGQVTKCGYRRTLLERKSI
jgi:hypothetical protein